jgi:hypothetical protein
MHGKSNKIMKNTQVPNFMKIRPVGAESFHAGGRRNSEADIRFSRFYERASY